ncbi:hypothetical protein ACH429_06985 [Streptomyces pathocidini]|uniref:Protein phosphatase 2C-like protein n=1 Tax=Streptomyces pathocidini TaxID=1650571 RepID=A0ABW7UR95_9ACTN|nr:hypothetical protein [Streptomyces pathocidini]
MRMDLATEPGDPRRPNEDYVSAVLPASGQGGALVLLDGVTPPEGDDGCVHGVPWFVARLGGKLLELSGSRRDMSLADCLAASISEVADTHRETCDLSHPLTPQATVVAARWGGGSPGVPEVSGAAGAEIEHAPGAAGPEVEYLVLSDSVLLLESAADGGTVTAVLDDRIDVLRAAGRRVAPLRNLEGGFFTAAADPGVARRAVTGAVPRSSVRALAALTDGAARWVEVFAEGGWPDCLALLRKEGSHGLIDRVRTLEAADPSRTAYRRGKTRDDAAVAFVEL